MSPVAGHPGPSARETTAVHTRLLKCALETEESRAYWRNVDPADASDPAPRSQRAFAGYWFGARSLARIEVLLASFRARFDAFPAALAVLRRWRAMPPDVRALVCHWHVQLSDPLYRAFAGEYLAARHAAAAVGPGGSSGPTVRRDAVVAWVGARGGARWGAATRIQLATNLLSCAFHAGLVAARRDPRPVVFPRVPDDALTYLLYLLRDVACAGTFLANPYLASVGLDGPLLEERLRQLRALDYRRMGDLVDPGWRYPDLGAWAAAALPLEPAPLPAGPPPGNGGPR